MVAPSGDTKSGGKKKPRAVDVKDMFIDKFVMIYSRQQTHQKGLAMMIKRIGLKVIIAEGDMKSLKKIVQEYDDKILAIIANPDPDARPAPYELIRYIRNQGDVGDHGWGDHVVVATLPVETHQEEFQRYLVKKEAQNQGTFLLTGDKFYFEFDDMKEFEFDSLERFFQNISIRSIAREVMWIADRFSENSELSMSEITTYLSPHPKYGDFASWLRKPWELDAAETNWSR